MKDIRLYVDGLSVRVAKLLVHLPLMVTVSGLSLAGGLLVTQAVEKGISLRSWGKEGSLA